MSTRFSLLFMLSLLLLSLSVNARPCKTLIISTYSFSLLPQNPDANANPNPEFIAVVAEVRPEFILPRHHLHRFFLNRAGFPAINRPDEDFLRQRPQLPPLEEVNSIRDRTRDILSVVASLLFGAACGALTAGTMFLIWSIFNHRNEESYRSLDGFSSSDDDYDEEEKEEDIFNPKKKGYVAITAAPTTPEADLAPNAAPAKEST